MRQTLIGLLDCNNFFVSCERLFRPDLLKKPVVVLSSNDGCVVARSEEIKDRGIAVGDPYFQIKDTLSQMGAVHFSSNFTLYRDISKRVFNVMKREIGIIEPYSIDECFFNLDKSEAYQTALRLQGLVLREVGLPVSLGFGQSRTQAKYANSIAKKTRLPCVLDKSNWEDRWHDIKLSKIWGVGAARTRLFSLRGLETVGAYLALPRAIIRQQLGFEGERLWAELRGEVSSRLVVPNLMQDSITSSRSFAQESTDQAVVAEALSSHLSTIVTELYALEAVVTSFRIIAQPSRFSDFALQGISNEVVLSVPTRDLFVLNRLIKKTLEDNFRPGVPYKKAGIVAKINPEVGLPSNLFPVERDERTRSLTDTILKVNQRHGKKALQLGVIVKAGAAWSTRSSSLSPAYTTDWESLKFVKA